MRVRSRCSQDCSVSCWRVLSARDVRLVWHTEAAHQLAVNVVVLSWCWLPAFAAADRDQGFESAPATSSSSSTSTNTSNEHERALELESEHGHEQDDENENESGLGGGQYLLAGACDPLPPTPSHTACLLSSPSPSQPPAAFASSRQLPHASQLGRGLDLNLNFNHWASPEFATTCPAGGGEAAQYCAPFAPGARINDLDAGVPAAFTVLPSTATSTATSGLSVTRTTPLNIGCGFLSNSSQLGVRAATNTNSWRHSSHNSQRRGVEECGGATVKEKEKWGSGGSTGVEGRVPSASRMQYAITGGGDRHVCVWDARSGARRATLRGHRRGVTSLATLAPDACAADPHAELQCLLVSGGADCEIRYALSHMLIFVSPRTRRKFKCASALAHLNLHPIMGVACAHSSFVLIPPRSLTSCHCQVANPMQHLVYLRFQCVGRVFR